MDILRFRDKLNANPTAQLQQRFLQIFKKLLQSDADFSNIYTWTRSTAALALALALAIVIAIATLYLPVRKFSSQRKRTRVLLRFKTFRRFIYL